MDGLDCGSSQEQKDRRGREKNPKHQVRSKLMITKEHRSGSTGAPRVDICSRLIGTTQYEVDHDDAMAHKPGCWCSKCAADKAREAPSPTSCYVRTLTNLSTIAHSTMYFVYSKGEKKKEVSLFYLHADLHDHRCCRRLTTCRVP